MPFFPGVTRPDLLNPKGFRVDPASGNYTGKEWIYLNNWKAIIHTTTDKIIRIPDAPDREFRFRLSEIKTKTYCLYLNLILLISEFSI